jgi:hypothetical protein
MCTNAQSIANRHVQIIRKLGEMAEGGELVEELVRETIRNCLTAMQTAGADLADAVEIVGDMLQQELMAQTVERTKFKRVLESAQMHAEYLLFTERYVLH